MTSLRRKLLEAAAFAVFLLATILWAAGAFRTGLVEPGKAAPAETLPAPGATATAERVRVPLGEEAVGTVRSRTRVAVAAQVMARILEVRADVGTAVAKGDPLLVLDDREARSRLARSRDAVTAAEASRTQAEHARSRASARRDQARSAYQRAAALLSTGTATTAEKEAAESESLQAESAVAEAAASVALAEAQIEQARASVEEATISLGYSRVASPIDGVVVERAAEPGDLAVPGTPVLVLLDPRALRLEAEVREGLVGLLVPGARLPVVLPGAGLTVEGTVAEIVPAADPGTRAFEVRVHFDAPPGVYPGMFGRLRFPAGEREVVRVPASAVVHVGQLRTVVAREEAGWVRRLVTTGADLGGGFVEVLSGLSGGETVGVR